MSSFIEDFFMYMQASFVQRAFIAGLAVTLCSSLLGVTLVLRRFSYIGDGLSHVAFGAMAFAAVMKFTDQMVLIMPATILCAIVLLCASNRRRLKGDAAVALISVSSLAVGYLVMNLFSASANVSGDVCTTLFGSTSILTLTKRDVWISVILSLIVAVLFVLSYNRIFSITFDENFARATGVKTRAYNLFLAVVIAIVIVLAMNLVGSLLVSALVIFPALSAMRLFRSFKGVTICAVIISLFCTFWGMVISIAAGTPVGSTIVAFDMAVFFVCMVFSHIHIK